MDERRAVVIGTGTMGPGIAEMFALGGFRTALCGRSTASVDAGLAAARGAGENLARFGLAAPDAVGAAHDRLGGTTDLAAGVAGAGIVVESIIEDLAAKQSCFEKADRAAPPDALLATNTSGLSITEIASATARPRRVAGMHWWNPPHLVPLVEVVRGEQTGDQTTDALVDIARTLGKCPVVVRRDVPGFIANRLQYALLREAAHIVGEGIASPEDVDRAMRAGPGFRYAALGPLEVADFIGLDLVDAIMEYLLPALSVDCETPAAVARRARSGRHGVKTGGGFYPYAGRSGDDVLTARDEKLARLLQAGFGR
ncbi:MAG: 3-hydroxyacyl-CoA dehydrogenase family protein [bacterium]